MNSVKLIQLTLYELLYANACKEEQIRFDKCSTIPLSHAISFFFSAIHSKINCDIIPEVYKHSHNLRKNVQIPLCVYEQEICGFLSHSITISIFQHNSSIRILTFCLALVLVSVDFYMILPAKSFESDTLLNS